MAADTPHEVTQLLAKWKQCDQSALDILAPMVDAELRRLAAGYMRNERPGHTLQPTALVNEAWMRMAQQQQPEFEGRSHFVVISAHYMRQILVEHARKKHAGKRGAGAHAVALDDVQLFTPERSSDLVALDDALKELARLHERQARVIELRYFGGMTGEEIAEVMNVAHRTIVRDLRIAQIWLRDYLAK